MRSATPLEITGRRGGMSSGTKGSGGAWSGGHGIRCAKVGGYFSSDMWTKLLPCVSSQNIEGMSFFVCP